MSFKLSIISRDSAKVAFVAGYGEATARTIPSVDQLLFDSLLGGGWAGQRIALDMDAVPYVDSSAIGWLINAAKHFRAGGGLLVLHSVQPHVKNIFGLLKIDKVVPIADDEEGARKLLTAKPERAKAAKKTTRAKVTTKSA